MTSLWLDRTIPDYPAPQDGAEYDIVVVGAGLTGLTTALLARAGRSVAVVEARHLGAGTTGNTTAKVSLLQGTRLSAIRRRHSDPIVRQYVEANSEGQAWLRRYCEEHSVPMQSRLAYTYAATENGIAAVQRELEAAQAAGLDVRWVTDTELPYPVRGAVELADQAQIDPLDVLTAMASDLLGRPGCVIYQGARVRSVSRDARPPSEPIERPSGPVGSSWPPAFPSWTAAFSGPGCNPCARMLWRSAFRGLFRRGCTFPRIHRPDRSGPCPAAARNFC